MKQPLCDLKCELSGFSQSKKNIYSISYYQHFKQSLSIFTGSKETGQTKIGMKMRTVED